MSPVLALAALAAGMAATIPAAHWACRTDPGPLARTNADDNEQRDPDYCWICRRKCGSKAHR
jgi:hypothetical protein